jgi:hypothetical protein
MLSPLRGNPHATPAVAALLLVGRLAARNTRVTRLQATGRSQRVVLWDAGNWRDTYPIIGFLTLPLTPRPIFTAAGLAIFPAIFVDDNEAWTFITRLRLFRTNHTDGASFLLGLCHSAKNDIQPTLLCNPASEKDGSDG